MKLLAKYKETTDLNRFLIKGVILYMGWRVLKKWIYLKGEHPDFTNSIATIHLRIGKFLLELLGFDVQTNYETNHMWISGANDSVVVIFDCLGINLYFIFFIFILAYPGKIRTKLWYIPSGLLAIFALNTMRMAALTPIVAKWPERMDLFHHYIFQAVMFLAIFGMWYYFTIIGKKSGNVTR